MGREIGRDAQLDLVLAILEAGAGGLRVDDVPVEDLAFDELVGQVPAGVDGVAVLRLRRLVLDDQSGGDVVEVTVRVPERVEIEGAVEQRDDRENREGGGGEAAPEEAAEFESCQ